MQQMDPGSEAALAARLTSTAVAALHDRRPIEALPSLDRLRILKGQAGKAAALRAEALLALGRATEADAASDMALQESPSDPARLELRARTHAACGRATEALDMAAAAVIAAPRNIEATLLFGTLLLEARRFDDAIQVLQDAESRHPSPSVQLRLGIALTRAGRHKAASAILDACAAHAPSLPGLPAARAQAAAARRCFDEAVAIAREALDRVGPDAVLYSTLAHALEAAGRYEEARPAFRAAARLAPDDPYLAHLVATADGATTDRAAAGYVASVFDGYANTFEVSLIALGYRVPGLIRRAVERQLATLPDDARRLGPVLDLGCGTGLVGVAVLDLLGAELLGVDLSRRMLDLAAEKGIYSRLIHKDLLEMLEEENAEFGWITAADVFCYLGHLDGVFALCARRLRPGGVLIFSVEAGEEGSGFRLHQRGRYAHAPDLVREGLAAAGLLVAEMRPEVLRTDLGEPVDGFLVVARNRS
jgi:predicted TPR repeat methyltransferase